MSRWLAATRQASPLSKLTELTPGGTKVNKAAVEAEGEVKSVKSVNSGRSERFHTSSAAHQPIPHDTFRHGRDLNGNPKTWTGRAVTLAAWRNLSDWDRHGSTGKVWNGLTRAWNRSKRPNNPELAN